ncbi:hypothetical protein [Dysgonomonas capnocytophagoides]|uniref:hypothetical protein n=1 Tax=Dysgonomonas capnocytophagoides TaxID=45254 RepID=UPI00047EDE59|nr:hypothetical protein [Dysgonomonas capnocytophagoides]
MNIQVKDKVGLSEIDVLALIQSLLRNRPPKDGSFDYGFETHGAIGVSIGDTGVPIQVYQQNKRSSIKSPIIIVIENHIKLF